MPKPHAFNEEIIKETLNVSPFIKHTSFSRQDGADRKRVRHGFENVDSLKAF